MMDLWQDKTSEAERRGWWGEAGTRPQLYHIMLGYE